MKKLLLTLCLLAFVFGSKAQSFDYPYIEDYGAPIERYLGAPDYSEGIALLPAGTDLWNGNEVNTIHYGRVPANSGSKPVLVFIHGYVSSAPVWFEGRDNMYADLYRDGYRSAYVSVGPNKHMWTNGNIIAKAVDKITSHYGVNKVVLVGWSKGGVDVDAALTHFGAHKKVSQAFTLSTPHNGTSIAELAHSVLLGLVNIIFMQDNDGTRALQRGYMDYFRSVTDPSPNNVTPFTTLGGWGNGPLNRLDIPQTILHGIDGPRRDGGNDGVVPYNSSRRPGGTELFSGQRKEYYWWGGWHYPGPSQTNLDHFEVTRGITWPYIKAAVQNNGNFSMPTKSVSDSYNPNTVVNSQMQILATTKGEQTLFIEPGVESVTLITGQKRENSKLSFTNAQGQSIRLTSASTELIGGKSVKNTYKLEGLTAGAYKLESDEAFVAVAMFDKGTEATLTRLENKRTYAPKDEINWSLELKDGNGKAINDALVTGVAIRTSTLEAAPVEGAEPMAVAFKQVDGRYVATLKGNKQPGIYSITVTAKAKNATRTVVSSLAVTGEFKQDDAAGMGLNIEEVYPNPFRGQLNIKMSLKGEEAAALSIYNIYGQLVEQFDLSGEAGATQMTWNAAGLEKGVYIIQLSDGSNKVSKKVILK